MKKTITAVIVLGITTGCAARGINYTPIVDLQGKRYEVYQIDLGQCQQYARQSMGAAGGAAAGALIGALLGAALAPKGYRNDVAGTTAAFGALSGAGAATDTQENIIKRCLSGRGYSVLN